MLNFLDFFSIAVQRTALQAAANCCRNASADNFLMIKDVWPILRNCLGYADQKIVDYAALCVIRVIESYHRSHADKLEALVDAELIRAVNTLLLPAGGSPLIPSSTFTLLVKSLATAARASPSIALAVLQADIVTTLFQILTGVLPPTVNDGQEQGNSANGQGLGGGLADMTIMQNLAHRSKEQVEESLTLISELMPPLPKGEYLNTFSYTEGSCIEDGTFDHKAYSEKALHRMIKAKAKADRAALRSAASGALASIPGGQSPTPSRAHTPTGGPSTPGDDDMIPNISANEPLETIPVLTSGVNKEHAIDRATLLRQHPDVVDRFIRLIVPILVDVYAASVSVTVRIKCLASLLKAICFEDGEQLKETLKVCHNPLFQVYSIDYIGPQNVPIASFASSILSSKDHPNLMIGALQMVELLLSKAASELKASFRREGVLHEIEQLASRTLPPKVKDKDKDKPKDKDGEQVQVKDTDGSAGADISDVHIPAPPSTKNRPHLLDPEDAYTLRARVIRFRYLSGDMPGDGDVTFMRLRHLVDVFNQDYTNEDRLRDALSELVYLFSSSSSTVSSFELLQSGLVDALLKFATSKSGPGVYIVFFSHTYQTLK